VLRRFPFFDQLGVLLIIFCVLALSFMQDTFRNAARAHPKNVQQLRIDHSAFTLPQQSHVDK